MTTTIEFISSVGLERTFLCTVPLLCLSHHFYVFLTSLLFYIGGGLGKQTKILSQISFFLNQYDDLQQEELNLSFP